MASDRASVNEAATQKPFETPFYAYHHFTKHTLSRLMSSHHHLDWANQPDPFRRYAQAALSLLPRGLKVSSLGYFPALEAMLVGQGVKRECALPAPEAADLSFLSNLLFYSLAISAWKQLAGTGSRWSLRVNPSSGNLHPTDTHILVHSFAGMDDGAYHYYVPEHALEKRVTGDLARSVWEPLSGGKETPPAVLCLTSIFWRESWKYRDRGYRYCQHDMGHALASVLLSAAILGWRAETYGEFPDEDLSRLIGLSASDEKPALVIGLWPGLAGRHTPRSSAFDKSWQNTESQFAGTPNALSRETVAYPSIDYIDKATCLSRDSWAKRAGRELPGSGSRIQALTSCGSEIATPYCPPVTRIDQSVSRVIRQRRSAIDLDGRQHMSLGELATILTSASRGFTADFQRPTAWEPDDPVVADGHHLVHLYLYVHRIDDLTAGIYYFDRIKQRLVPLALADEREAAKYASCFQDIAADGCFALSMIADFNTAYELYGDRGYRYVHYEAGLIGQWLYLSSTALGYDATGIGCFLDDVVNNLLALPPGLECIYNFTVGRAVLDPRLTTLPSYDFPDPAL